MPVFWSCSAGHRWEISAEQQAAGSVDATLCPICGIGPVTPPPPKHLSPRTDHPDPLRTELLPAATEQTDPGSPASEANQDFAVGPQQEQQHGRFRRLRKHAKGGLGKVSIALDEELQREVALKEIRSEYADDPQNRRRFLAEAKITGRLEHPGIVPIYALGRNAGGRPYYAMKLVHGKTFHDAIRDYHALPTPLEFRQLLRRFIDVCQAIAFAHRQGVIHRDLKPANVMIGEYGETLVLDWGLAKVIRSDAPRSVPVDAPSSSTPDLASQNTGLTMAGQVLGTPAYMSPEQAAGELAEVGPASDVYALGAMLYEFLTCRPPFDEMTTVELIERKRHDPPPAPSWMKAGIPRPLEAICLKAMARSASDRYATPRELAEDVERWLADEAILAYREPLLGRMSRWARRHKPLVAALAVLPVVAIVGLIISNYFIRAEQKETELARQDVVRRNQEMQHRFNQVNLTLDRMMARLGQNRLALVSHMDLKSDPVTWGLLLEARRFYEGFLPRANAPDRPYEQLVAHRRIGDIYRMQGAHREAENAYKSLVAMLERLISDGVHLEFHRGELGAALHDLAPLYHTTDRISEAEELYRRALALQESVPANHEAHNPLAQARTHHQLALLLRDTGDLRQAKEELLKAYELRKSMDKVTGSHELQVGRDLAQTQIDLSYLLAMLNDPTRAEELSRQAIGSLTQLVKGTEGAEELLPELAEYRHELAGAHNNLGLVLARTKPQEAEAAYQAALKIREQLVRSYPVRPDYRYELALCRINRGVLLFTRGTHTQAQDEWGRARDELDRLVRDFPDQPIYTSRLGQVLNNLAAVHDERKDLSQAALLLKAAVEHQRRAWRANPRHPEYQSRLRDALDGLADIQLRSGNHADAAASADELPALNPRDAELPRRAAGFLARCAAATEAGVRDAYAGRAVAHLKSAVERGYRNAQELRTAADLKALQELPAFKRLVAGIE